MDDEILKEFLVESTEILDQLDKDFVELEQRPQDHDLLGAIFRAVHTIKGTCGFFGFSQLESMTHAGENLLDKLRDGKLTLTEDMIGVLLRVCDASLMPSIPCANTNVPTIMMAERVADLIKAQVPQSKAQVLHL